MVVVVCERLADDPFSISDRDPSFWWNHPGANPVFTIGPYPPALEPAPSPIKRPYAEPRVLQSRKIGDDLPAEFKKRKLQVLVVVSPLRKY